MNNWYDLLTAWGTIALAVIAIVAIWCESRSSRLSRAADVTLRVIDKFDDEKMLNLRHKAATSIRDFRQGKGKISKDVENVLDFFETMGLFCKRGVIDEEIVWHSFYYWIRGYYWSAKDFIDERRRDEPTVYEDLVALYRQLVMIEDAGDDIPSKDDLDEFIDEEIKEVTAQLELKKSMGRGRI
jgi:hypothetical protein